MPESAGESLQIMVKKNQIKRRIYTPETGKGAPPKPPLLGAKAAFLPDFQEWLKD